MLQNSVNSKAMPRLAFMLVISKHTDGIPLDGSPVDVVQTSVLVAGLIYAFSFATISFILLCLGFNIIFHKRKWVWVCNIAMENLCKWIDVKETVLQLNTLLLFGYYCYSSIVHENSNEKMFSRLCGSTEQIINTNTQMNCICSIYWLF